MLTLPHISGAVLPVLLALTPIVPAYATPPEPSDFTLTVSPSRMVVPADEIGQPRQFTVTNGGRSAIDVSTRTASFVVDSTGELTFRSDAARTAIGWVTVGPEHFRLAPGAAKLVDLRIAVPASAEPGEHQVAVIFSTPPPAGARGLSVRRSVGAPVYVTVPGDAVEAGRAGSARATGVVLPLHLVGPTVGGLVLLLLLGWMFRRRRVRPAAVPPAASTLAGDGDHQASSTSAPAHRGR
ncbi:hypothetical protein C7C45_23500 [Micromonospora arborensis]|uniref:DUF916 domain-containing protein n=1 Tax=Micromonospora arborensis TaxID=2116518 RepID=A0A318NE64_9ACTN|nr:hypothetical protein [Micromonospora arborensis]PYC66862.1 hypothetical protein C7C45_23500 [Micromonospora arborensis]